MWSTRTFFINVFQINLQDFPKELREVKLPYDSVSHLDVTLICHTSVKKSVKEEFTSDNRLFVFQGRHTKIKR